MKAQVTWKGMRFESDTISVFDNDGREIALHRDEIPKLIGLLQAIQKREYGRLPLEVA